MQIQAEVVLKKAQQYAPGVMKKFGLPTNKFCAEDVVGEFLVKFYEKGFDKKFDENTCSLEYYIYQGVRNVAVSMARKTKYEQTSVEELTPAQMGDRTVDFMDELLLDEIVDLFGNINFGYGNVVEHDGRKYASNSGSVIRLLYLGMDKKTIAQMFGVTTSTIANVLDKVKQYELKEYYLAR